MQLGVLSDTHDRLETIDIAFDYFRAENITQLIHCGDWKSLRTAAYCAEAAEKRNLSLHGVLGNNDVDVSGFMEFAAQAPDCFKLYDSPYTIQLDSGEYLAAYHGHHKPTLRRLLADPTCRILLLGHSHTPKIEDLEGKLIVNPGSTAFAIPRSKVWRPSVAVVDTELLSAEIIYLA